MPRSLFFALLPLVAPSSVIAQVGGGTAHLYAYTVTNRPAFEEGYRAHLRWHVKADDALVWYAWYVVAGDRAGAFVDGTFGTTAQGLADRPDPNGDAADFRSNAAPFAKPIGDERWELWREVSAATPLEGRHPEPLIQVHRVITANPSRFEALLRADPIPGASWYRAPSQSLGTYLVLAATGSAQVAPSIENLFGAGHSALPFARSTRSEVWRYEPRLALLPGTPLMP